MENLHELCAVSDLEADVPFECMGPNDQLIAVVLHNDKIYAVDGECPHQQAPMVDGDVIDGTITCCLHFWSWNLEDGEPVEEAEMPLPVYTVKVENDTVYMVL